MKAYEARLEKQDANEALAKELQRQIGEATQDEIRTAKERLNIHPQTGLFMTEEQISAREKQVEKKRKQQERDARDPAVQGPSGGNGSSKRGASGLLGPPPKRTRA